MFDVSMFDPNVRVASRYPKKNMCMWVMRMILFG